MKIVLLPGLDGTGDLLGRFERLLTKNYSTQVLSFPAELHRYADIENWLTKKLPKDDYFIIAESFSGPLAVQIAAARPSNLMGVAFVATFARSPKKIPSRLTFLLRFLPIKSKVFVRVSLPFLMGRFASEDFAVAMYNTLQRLPMATIIGRLREVLNVNVQEELQSICVPCAYLAANGDRLVSSTVSHDFRNGEIEYLTIDGPHFILQARPEEAYAIVLNFIRKLSL